MNGNVYADKQVANKARRLAAQGLKGRAIADALKIDGVGTNEANILASVGAAHEHEEVAALSADELALLRALAWLHRSLRDEGELASPKAKQVAWRLRWSVSKVRRLTHKRLMLDRDHPHGFDLLTHSRNGHLWLKRNGWMLVRAIEYEGRVQL